MEINTLIKGKNIIIDVNGNIDLNNFDYMQKVLLDHCKNIKGKRLVIDMKNVPYIDSSGISVLMLAFKECYENEGEFCLWNVTEHVKEILKLTHVDKMFKICTES